MSDQAVFFDPTHRRWWWFKRVGTLVGLFAVVTVSVWLLSLFTAPLLPGLAGITAPSAQELRRAMRRLTRFPRHQSRMELFLLKQDRGRLLGLIARDQKAKAARAALPPIQGGNIVAAFYAPWQETGVHTLEANAKQLTHLLPAWVHLTEDGKGLDTRDWDPRITPLTPKVVEIARLNNLNIVPVFSNAQQATFDSKRVHVFLTDHKLQDRVIRQLLQWVRTNGFQGINVDFENLDQNDYALYVPFLQRMKTAFGPKLVVSADLEPGRALNWSAVSSVCDFVVVMAYNEHAETSKPGAIASMDWYRRNVIARAVRDIPREKLVIGLANFGYDWMEGRDWADPLTYQNAIVVAEKYRPGEKPEDVVDFDDKALNPTFSYEDDDGKQHEVWFLDGVTAANQWLIAQAYAPRGVALWVLGSADPSVWTFINRGHLNDPLKIGDLLKSVQYSKSEIDFEGDGEIAHVEGNPSNGERTLEIDPRTGLAVDEAYKRFPQPTVILRTGYKPKMIALTIDDGPSVPYTGQILDELKALNVKATFFLIGENAERYPGLVHRIWNEGHEIGNHSFTHPNTGAISEQQAKLELTATQRVLQTLLHRSTLLFRPPYNADAEPTTEQEVQPIRIASELNYITVLEFIDAQDWNIDYVKDPDGKVHRRNENDMLRAVQDQIDRERGSNILLHDGGGDRSATVKLIPLLVQDLTKKGYKFVTVSDLLGATRDDVNPPLKNADMWMMASDRVVFESIYLFELFLRIAFITGIVLGAARVFFVTLLAIIGKIKEGRATYDETYQPSVTVVIAAFNEEKVIARTIRAVLASRYEALDIIVVDDGSKDATSAEVLGAFGDNSKVRLLRQDNGGKAAALNRGISQATGEVIIALDADTIFARNTIAKLVRHFADPLVGAVAGNVKVGNRINPLTYWQSIEYVTSQNLDRRAYAVINSVTVVPGAVGAWRREAIKLAGGYSTDTMAEDMDLTWRIRRIGYRVVTDSDAIGYTEAPDSFRTLFRQRFRWAFGTLQCLWKHRRAVGRYGWFGRVMIPSLWLFQVVFQVLSPLIDLQIAWTLGTVVRAWMRGHLVGDWQPMPQALTSLYLVGFMYAFFFVVELIGSLVAFRLDREDPRVLIWLFWQRFLYRQLMYAVLLKSIKTAVSGIRAGWGKLDRKGTVELVPEVADPRAPV